MSNCVAKNEAFYNLALEHGIDGSELELIVHKYWNEVGKEDSFPPSDYIDTLLGIGQTYEESGEYVRKLWEDRYTRPILFTNRNDLNNAVQEAKRYFPPEAIVTYKTDKNKYLMRIKEPVNTEKQALEYEKEIKKILDNAPRDAQGRLLAPNGKPSNLTDRQYAQVRTKAFKDWFGDWESANTFAKDKIDLSKVEIEEYDRSRTPGYNNKALKIYLKGQREKGYFEIVKDNEFGQYSIHFKTATEETGETTTSAGEKAVPSTKEERNILWQQLINALPEGATVSTWGTLSEHGIRALNKIGRLGNFTKIGERTVSKKQSAGGGEVNIPIWQKGGGTSKVVDENGEPLVVYHGTDEKFTTFDYSKYGTKHDEGVYGRGHYFTSKKDAANHYAGGKLVYETFLNIRNPYSGDLEYAELLNREMSTEQLADYFEEAIIDQGETRTDFIKKLGNLDNADGVIVNSADTKFDEIVVFNSNQIKSATDNVGTFNTLSNNINEDVTSTTARGLRAAKSYTMQDALTALDNFLQKIDFNGEYGKQLKDFIDEYGIGVINLVILGITNAGNHSASWTEYTRALKLGFSEMATSEERAAVLLHELLHSKTTALAALYEQSKGIKTKSGIRGVTKGIDNDVTLKEEALTPEISKAFDELAECKEEVIKYLESNQDIKEALISFDRSTNLNKRPLYFLLSEGTNKYEVREFISELWSNPEFIRLLDKIPSAKKKTLWQRINDALRAILGLKKNQESVLDRARRNAETIIRIGNNVDSAFKTISEDISTRSPYVQRALLKNYYADATTKSQEEFNYTKALATNAVKNLRVNASSEFGMDFTEIEDRVKEAALNKIQELGIDSDMILSIQGIRPRGTSFAYPKITFKTYSKYRADKTKAAWDYVRSLSNDLVLSEVIRLSAEGEMEDSTFTFNDGTTINTPFELNDLQKAALQALDDFCNDESRTSITLSGYAGTGKTSLMEMVAKKARKDFKDVVFSATTNKASGVLKSKVEKLGFGSSTVNTLFGIRISTDLEGDTYDVDKTIRINNEDKLDYGSIVIIDEASMLSEDNYDDVVRIAGKKGAKVIFVGDSALLSPVKEGLISKVFRSDNGEVIELTKVERTGDNAILAEATSLRNNQPLTYESSFNDRGLGVAYVTPQSGEIDLVIAELSQGLRTNPDYFRVLTFDNNAAANYNIKIRRLLGLLGLPPQVGEPVMGYNNWGYDKSLAHTGASWRFVNSESYKVVESNETRKEHLRLDSGEILEFEVTNLVLENPLGELVTVPFIDVKNNILNRNNVLKAALEKPRLWSIWRSLGKGDPLRDLILDRINDIEKFLFVNDHIYDSRGTRVHKKVIDFGYAHTTHKSLGCTFTHVLLDDNNIEHSPASSLVKQQLRYVGLTRATDTVTVISSNTRVAGSPLTPNTTTDIQQANINNLAPERPVNTTVQPIDIWSTNENKHLSNFAIRPFSFTWQNGVTTNFVSVEQAFQYTKALMAGDMEIAQQILNTTEGAVINRLGNQVRGLDVAKWDANSAQILAAFMAKSFMDNTWALESLLATGDATLTHNKATGKYKELFPRILMELRELLKGYKPTKIEKPVSVSTEGYRKGDPQSNPNTAYIFTENAEAYMYSNGIRPSSIGVRFPNPNAPKINVSDVNGTNLAGIRTDAQGNISKNAFGIVVKKHQLDANGNFVKKEGQFLDTQKDFNLFRTLNTQMFDRLQSLADITNVVLPSQMALGKAALPLRFAEWLKDLVEQRFGVQAEITPNTTPGYEGYGLTIKNQSQSSQAQTAQTVIPAQTNMLPTVYTGSRTGLEAGTAEESEARGIAEQQQVQEDLGAILGDAAHLAEAQQEIQGAIAVAQLGITLELALGLVQSIFTSDEIQQIKQATNGGKLKVMSVSRQTDPAFFSQQIVQFLELNAQKPFTDPTRVNCIEVWTKHDGMPIADILEACRKYKVAPMVSFSITSLGDTALEKGVLKHTDLLPLIGQLIEKGYLNPTTTTVRIDPILPGVTDMELIRYIVNEAKKLGIKKFVTSLVLSYGYLDGTSRDRKVTSGINAAMASEGKTYDWDKYYGRDARGKISFKPKQKYINEIGMLLLELNQDPSIEIQTCAFSIPGLKASACLDPLIIERVTGIDVTRPDRTYDRDTSRPDCMCYGNHSDMFRVNEKKCFSSCAYCYASHSGDNNLSYYNEDGTLKQTRYVTVADRNTTPTATPTTAAGTSNSLAASFPMRTPNPQGPLVGYTLHSGGAKGADYAWGNIGAEYGVVGKHYYDASEEAANRRPPYANTPITDEERVEGERKAFYASKQMGTLGETAQLVKNPLLIRNWNQVKNADVVIAIADKFNRLGEKLTNDPNDTRTANMDQVDGGTGWAVQMAVNEGKTVFVYNQTDKKWYVNIAGQWNYCETPVLTENFAGIGTRNINSNGIAAIRSVYEKTVLAMQNSSRPDVGEVIEQAHSTTNVDSLSDEMRKEFDKLIARDKKINALLTSDAMTPVEVRQVAEDIMNLISDHITQIMEDKNIDNPELIEKGQEEHMNNLLVNLTYNGQEGFEPFNPKGMSRREVINKIGIELIINKYVANKLTSQGPSEKAKLRLIKLNLDGILHLGAHQLAYNEGIHISTDNNGNRTVEEGVTTDTPDLNNTENPMDFQETLGSLQLKWQVDFRTEDVLGSMAQVVRQRLTQFYDTNSDGTIKKGLFGINKKVKIQQIVNQILNWCQGCLSLEDMATRLKEHKADSPWVKQLIELIDLNAIALQDPANAGKYTDFQSSFFSVFDKHFQLYGATRVKYNLDGTQTIESISLNEKPVLNQILSALKADAAAGIHPLINSNNTINRLALEQLRDTIRSLYTIKLDKLSRDGLNKMSEEDKNILFYELSQAAAKLGYPVDVDTLKSTLTGKDVSKAIDNLLYIYDDLFKNITNPYYEPFAYKKDKNTGRVTGILGNLRNFLDPLTKHLQDITATQIFDSGKLYQSFVTPNYWSKLMGKFDTQDEQQFKEFMENEFGQYEWFKNRETGEYNHEWLARMLRDPEARKAFKHKVELNYNQHNYMKSLTGNEYIMSLLSNFFCEGAAGKDSKDALAWYRVTILSNKPSAEFVRFYADMSTNYKDNIAEQFLKVVNLEMSRIQTVRMLNLDKDDPNFIKNFHKNGGRFCFLDFLNDYLEENERYGLKRGSKVGGKLGLLLNLKLDAKAVDEVELNRLLKIAIKQNIQEKVDKIMQDYTNRGIMEAAKSIKGINEGQGFLVNIEKFLWNDAFAATQIMELEVTDMAFYKDMEDLLKRVAQIHSPGVRGNADAVDYEGKRVSDGYERTLYLTDWDNVVSNIKSNVDIVFQRKIANAKSDIEKEFYTNLKKQLVGYTDKDGKYHKGDFDKINVADAQGYSSPTSYRKKAFIFGRWSREAENIYQKLKSGDYTYHDLEVAFQPLKPFVYSQIPKSVGVKVDGKDTTPITKWKVPVQNKNSEYLLVLADAILLGEDTGQPNLLRAIYEAMEESAYDNGVYNGRGIDTVQFESTVKSGLQGRINLNQVLLGDNWKELVETQDSNGNKKIRTRGEVAAKALLKQCMYNTNADGTRSYNQTYIHEIPFEDYCIQLEVPEHFKNHSQQHGSQIRMIIPSDLVSVDALNNPVMYKIGDRMVTAEEFRSEYEETIAENIQLSIDKLYEELHLNAINPVERNIVLSRMLQNEILDNPRYGMDMYLACSLNPQTGEFRIPLGDPIHANRIEQLLNSIIKKRINKQEIAGGPVVQVTNYGTSRRLNIRFKSKELDANGNATLLKTRDEFTRDWVPSEDNDDVEEAYKKYIEENQAGIAYFEVFAPIPFNGIFEKFADPDGVIDIQTLEEVAPEALQMIGYRIPTEDKYSCAPIKIVGFLPRLAGEGIMLPYDITLLTGSDFDVDKEYLMRKQVEIVHKDFAQQRDLLYPIYVLQKEKELGRELTKEEKSFANEDLSTMIESFRKSGSKNISTPLELKMWNLFKQMCYTIKPLEERKKINDNKIFDMTWEVLTHETVADKVLNPGGFEEQKREAYKVAAYIANPEYTWEQLDALETDELKSLSYKSGNLLYVDTQVDFYEKNNAASTILGMFAVLKIAHATLEGSKYLINVDEVCPSVSLDGFTILGKTFKGFMEIDPTFDDNGTLIGKTLGSHVAAAADAAKEPCLNLLNINSQTAGVFSTLLRLGMPFKEAALFMAQPAIREALKDYSKRNLMNDFASLSTIMHERIKEFQNDGQMQDTSLDGEPLTKEELIKNLRENVPEINYKVMRNFLRIMQLANAIKGPTYITRYNSINNAVGPLLTDSLVTEFKAKYDSTGLYTKDKKELTKEIIFRDHPILAKFAKAYDVADDIFKDFPTKSKAFSDTLKALPANIGDMMLNDRTMLNDLKDFFLSYAVVLNGVVPENRAMYYIKQFAKDFGTTNIKGRYPDNEFVLAIQVEFNTDTGEYSLKIPTTGMDLLKKDRLTSYWYQLYKQNPLLAKDLFNYCFFMGGIGFTPKTFMNLVPIQMLEELPRYRQTFTNIKVNAEFVAELYLAHNTSNYRFFPALFKEGLEYQYNNTTRKIEIVAGGLVLPSTLGATVGSSFKFKDSNNKWRYLLIQPRLCRLNEMVYKEITPLGNRGEYLEINTVNTGDRVSIQQLTDSDRRRFRQLRDLTVQQAHAQADYIQQQQLLGQQQGSPLQIVENPSIPTDSTDSGRVPLTPGEEKIAAEKILQGLVGIQGVENTLAAKALMGFFKAGIFDINAPLNQRLLTDALESHGLHLDINELKDRLDELCS